MCRNTVKIPMPQKKTQTNKQTNKQKKTTKENTLRGIIFSLTWIKFDVSRTYQKQ